ncbi:lytic transglycosylase domain-containing protein [Guyparkeria halophila]|uniref:Lytic transglycosylase domain-containing protein n=1 Tax=Guyparkeria halophila TaxID=47960 RepID=A0ABZ0YXY8_9GAMM|nr:lytic transglycosylase domain-containing protein [Guyparkeria halophila]WQH16157.1 lytic transglycosylase domain-containing protein [Guyparkeria halophila]
MATPAQRCLLRGLILFALAAMLAFLSIASGQAAGIPHAAETYQRDLTREANRIWGLGAPVAGFAAQIHAESAWRPDVVSPVGASGLAQFMPATARWICGAYDLPGCETTNPRWAMRALVTYDRHLYDLCHGHTDCDRAWCALRSYNGGLGHYRNEAANAADPLDHRTVDAACGSASRSARHCAENLGYPRRIIYDLQPRYVDAGWGTGWPCREGCP